MLPNEEGFSNTKSENPEKKELMLPPLRDNPSNGLKAYCSERIVIYEKRPQSFKDYIVHQQFTRNDKTFKYEVLKNEEVNGMQFDSHFDSGNLHQVLYVNDETFELVVQSDLNTHGYTNWFYFKITLSDDAPESINLQVINLSRQNLLFTIGQQPVMRSKQLAQQKGMEWFRTGEDISYFQNDVIVANSGEHYNTLKFTVIFPRRPDIVWIAMNYPYPCTTLHKFISNAQTRSELRDIDKYLTIEDIGPSFLQKKVPVIRYNQKASKTILIMGRQHPSETFSSYVVQHLIENLLFSENSESLWLREQFEWIFIPILNVDGVDVGNSRCDATGHDMNRQWRDTYHDLYPQIERLKNMCFNDLAMVFDVHSHSKELNAFTYGCSNDVEEVGLLPIILDSLSHIFKIEQCGQSISQEKLKSARSFFFNNLKCNLTYTLEVSQAGYNKFNVFKQINLYDIKKFANDLLKSIFILYEGDKQVEQPYNPQMTKITAQQKIKEYLNLNNPDDSDTDSHICIQPLTMHDFSKIKHIHTKKSNHSPKSHNNNTHRGQSFSQRVKELFKRPKKFTQFSPKISPKITRIQLLDKPNVSKIKQIKEELHKEAFTIPTKQQSKLFSLPTQVTEVFPRKKITQIYTKHVQTSMTKQTDASQYLNDLLSPIDLSKIKEFELPTRPSYRERMKQRQRLSELRLEIKQKSPIIRHDPSLLLWQDRLKDKGNVLFQPYGEKKRVHSFFSKNTSPLRLQQKKFSLNMSEFLMRLASEEEFEEYDLDPQSVFNT